MRIYQNLTRSLRLVADDPIRPLRTGVRRPGDDDIEHLSNRPRSEVEILLEEKQQGITDPAWGHLLNFVGVIGLAFSVVSSGLIAFAGFMAGDPRLQTKLTVQDAGQTYVEVMEMVCGLAVLLILFYAALSFRANLYRNRCIEWSTAAKSALTLIEKRTEVQNSSRAKRRFFKFFRRG